MTDFRKGDVCSLEVVVESERLSGDYGVMLLDAAGNTHMPIVSPSDLTLIRRPVDLATCELPVEVVDPSGHKGTAIARDVSGDHLIVEAGPLLAKVRIDALRPLDAPAPDKSEVERMRARVERLAVALRLADDDLASMDAPRGQGTTRGAIAAALASTAPTCPPNHIMIGDRAVPEPMRVEPGVGAAYWAPAPASPDLVFSNYWEGRASDRHRLRSGLIHSTEANARAHAEAIIAMSARGDGHE